jgi:hypothetical protein
VTKEEKESTINAMGVAKVATSLWSVPWRLVSNPLIIFIANQMLEGGFLAKVSDFKPRPSLLYLEAKISGRDLSCLIDIEATQSFMSSKLAKELDLRVQKASKSINVHFAKGEPHKTQEVALDVTLECEKLDFR